MGERRGGGQEGDRGETEWRQRGWGGGGEGGLHREGEGVLGRDQHDLRVGVREVT